MIAACEAPLAGCLNRWVQTPDRGLITLIGWGLGYLRLFLRLVVRIRQTITDPHKDDHIVAPGALLIIALMATAG